MNCQMRVVWPPPSAVERIHFVQWFREPRSACKRRESYDAAATDQPRRAGGWIL